MSLIIVASQEGMRQMMGEPVYSHVNFTDGERHFLLDLNDYRKDTVADTARTLDHLWNDSIRLIGAMHDKPYTMEVLLLGDSEVKAVGQWLIPAQAMNLERRGL